MKQTSYISVFVATFAACSDPTTHERAEGDASVESGSTTETEAVEIDASAIFALAMSYPTMLVPMTDGPEASETHSDAASVRVWGLAESAATFHSIDPDDSLQEVTFPEGTLFVKEHFDELSAIVGWTVMYKGPAGYHETGRNWFWGRMYDGEITHEGRVEFCIGCHEAAHNTDFVVGFGKSP